MQNKVLHPGKTRRDRESGAWEHRFENREARVSWQKMGGKFPFYACNGKKNKYKKEE